MIKNLALALAGAVIAYFVLGAIVDKFLGYSASTWGIP